MKNVFTVVAAVVLAVTLTSCGGDKHFLTKKVYRDQVHNDFLERRELAAGRADALFSVFDREGLTAEQKEALEFLYAYMPLCDLSEYDGDFFLRQVDGAFRARDHFSWGKSVPEEIFRHFVLVHRINNEYLDEARDVFFDELKDRVKGMTMEQAALEVNHWCHEKVTYRATDGRTSAPLALVRTSWGRCGEESTFTTAALRAVGIPARQVYTPRWVHSDSNHAWVEVWIDGKWYYLGACEPEPELNVAWFTAPAKRMMMGHTTVFGLYDGPEEKNVETDLYSTINLTDIYAPIRKAGVTVVDQAGNPVEGATVKFLVYNYGTTSPLVTAKSGKDGKTAITTGLGDLLVWVNKDDKYGYVKSTQDDAEVTVTLSREPGEQYAETFVMNVPVEQGAPAVDPELLAKNAVRLAQEDSIRNAYMSTFTTEEQANELAASLGLKADQVWRYMHMSQGNHAEIRAFLTANKDNPRLFPFLATLRDKDVRDTPAAFLNDHLQTTVPVQEGTPEDMIAMKVLSPRIGNELIKPWRSFFNNDPVASGLKSGAQVAQHVRDNIVIDSEQNYYNCMLTPQGVHELKVSDTRSRDIYFVALCRAAGIPAHFEPMTGKTQYYEGGQWHDVRFGDTEAVTESNAAKGQLTLNNDPANILMPGYGSHFTVAKFQDGDFQSLFLGRGARRGFPIEVDLDEGYYRILTASRANDGSVMITTQYLDIAPGKPQTATITLPVLENKMFVKGIVDMNTIVTLNDGNKATLKEISNGKGVMLVFADPDKEPTKHILQDIPAQKSELDSWGGGVLFMVPDDKLSVSFDPSQFRGLPERTTWGTDNGRVLLNAAAEALQIEFSNNFPLTLYLNSNGGVLFSAEGYRIGIGENVLKTILLEKQSMEK